MLSCAGLTLLSDGVAWTIYTKCCFLPQALALLVGGGMRVYTNMEKSEGYLLIVFANFDVASEEHKGKNSEKIANQIGDSRIKLENNTTGSRFLFLLCFFCQPSLQCNYQ
jgi:hypothetical protein